MERLATIIGSNKSEIQRRSYCSPSENESRVSVNPRSGGLKAKNVASLNKVKSSRNSRKRLMTQSMVFGIL